MQLALNAGVGLEKQQRYKEALRIYADVMKRFESDSVVVSQATSMYTTTLLLMASDSHLYVNVINIVDADDAAARARLLTFWRRHLASVVMRSARRCC